jgi:hypothetical protein
VRAGSRNKVEMLQVVRAWWDVRCCLEKSRNALSCDINKKLRELLLSCRVAYRFFFCHFHIMFASCILN